jgi:nitroimidazol reductase NimA-like FMN-containing flavoprotein (pyridoxamine 5'-phosphate oxidase superfamily)
MADNEDNINQHGSAQEIIHQALICHLACCIEGEPYCLPLAFGFDGQDIFFHTGKKGRKISALSSNPRVCLAFEINVQLQKDPDQACEWSFSYQSVIVDGMVEELNSLVEKEYALNQIMDHYSKSDWTFPEKQVAATRVWKVTPGEITVKIESGE